MHVLAVASLLSIQNPRQADQRVSEEKTLSLAARMLTQIYTRKNFSLGAVHILRNTLWGGRGSSRFITILHRGGLESLLQYYSFEWKMEGYIPFELSKKSPFHTC